MKTSHALRNFLFGSSLLAAVTATTHAVTKTWDGSDTDNWGLGANWTPSGPANNITADDALFTSTSLNGFNIYLGTTDRLVKGITFDSTTGANSYAINLQAGSTDSTIRTFTVGAGGVTVQAGSHSFKGVTSSSVAGDLKLTSGSAFNIAAGSTLTFESKLAASSSSSTFSKTGLGTLVLKANNGGGGSWNFSSGLFTISEGTLELAASGATGNSGNDYAVSNNATLKISASGGWGATAGTLSLSGTGVSGIGALYSTATTSLSATSLALATNSSIGVEAGQILTINPAITGSTFALTKVGAGTLTLTNTNTYTGTTTVTAGKLVINGAVASTSLVVNGSLGGSGTMANATLSGSGSIDPGNSPGIQTAVAVDPSGGLDFNFEFTQAGTDPDWAVPTGSINDVLRLTDATSPITSNMNGGNIINIYLNVGSLADGQTYTGGFFTDKNAAFRDTIIGADFKYYLFSSTGATTYNDVKYDLYTGPLDFSVSTISKSADFDGAGLNPAVTGYVTQFTVVPEPGAALLGSLGLLALLRRRRF